MWSNPKYSQDCDFLWQIDNVEYSYKGFYCISTNCSEKLDGLISNINQKWINKK